MMSINVFPFLCLLSLNFCNFSASFACREERDVYRFFNDSCIYIRELDPPEIFPIEWAVDQCGRLNESDTEWGLPVLDTTVKNEKLYELLARARIVGTSEFWIGLIRDDAEQELNEDEITDQRLWAKPEKWRWSWGERTLANFEGGQAPWSVGEPNNHGGWNETCALAYRDTDQSKILWQDHGCNYTHWPPLQLLICQSRPVSNETDTTDDVSEAADDWLDVFEDWPERARSSLALGLSVGLVLGCLVIFLSIFGALWYRKRRYHSRAIVITESDQEVRRYANLLADQDDGGNEEDMGRRMK